MNPRRRDGVRAWSSWEHFTSASLHPEDRKRARRQPPLTHEQIRQRRWKKILVVFGTMVGIGLICLLLAIAGHRIRSIALVSVAFVFAPMVVVAITLGGDGDTRLLIRLRRRRVATMRSLTNADSAIGAIKAIRRRRALASERLSRPDGYFRAYVMTRAHPVSAQFFTVGTFLFWTSRIFQPTWMPGLPIWVEPLGMATGAGLVIYAIFRFRAERRRLLAAVRGSACPDCGFPLDGVRPVVIAAPEQAAEIGPAVCPECGCPWPLVPPDLGEAVRSSASV